MKQLLIVILLFVSFAGNAQVSFSERVRDLDAALVIKDTAYLGMVLHDKLSYGHSNGWVETKPDMIAHLFNGKLSYTKVNSKTLSVEQAGNVAIVRTESNVVYVLNGNEGHLKMHILQVWVMNEHGWQLLSRQSTKVE